MKKLVAILGSALFFATSAGALMGCGGKENADEKTVMNISLNPSVEFVLDKDNKVVSVNALNEEGNLIVSAEAFVGKDADEAAQLFVQVSKETGFLVEGNATVADNKLSISISGDEKAAAELYNDVKAEVNAYFSAENVTATIEQAAAITEEQLEKLVAECAPYMEEAEVKALEYNQLVETLYQSRKETAEFYSQELKNAYYEAKAFALQQSELETLKSKVSGFAQIALDAAYKMYADAVSNIETLRMQTLVNEDSPYQLALKEFREAKTAYLSYRADVAAMEQTQITQDVLTLLNSYEQAVNTTEQALLTAGTTANTTLDTVKVQIKTAYETVVALIEDASIKASEFLGEISTNQQAAKKQFFTEFETNYAAAITAAESNWKMMKESLQGTDVDE
jgi:hypothetical protein